MVLPKLAQLLSMIVFNEHFQGDGRDNKHNAPGAVKRTQDRKTDRSTGGIKEISWIRSLKSPEISAEALYCLGVSKEMEDVSGKFFNLTTEEEPAPPALDREAAYELWEKTLEMSGTE